MSAVPTRFSARIAARNKPAVQASQPILIAKKRMSPFIAFCFAKRDHVIAANPTIEFGEKAKLLALMWKSLSESEKAAYA
jgi:hypothetical protein